MRFSDIESQTAFVKCSTITAVNELMALKGFAPREFYSKINNFRHQHQVGEKKKPYWHSVGLADASNMHRDYFMNEAGDSVHLSFKVANNIGEQNEVHFGGSSAEVRKLFLSEIAKMRRLAKVANADLKEANDNYRDTPEGICDTLDNMCRDLITELCDLVGSRRHSNHYSQIRKSSGSNRTQYYYEQWQTGEIGRLTYKTGNSGWKGSKPAMPEVTAFFENPDMMAQVQAIIAKLAPMQERFHSDIIEAWETQEILKRLKGERELVEAEDTPW